MSAPLLFLGHAADRTGPPIYLLHLLRWLRAEHPGVDFEIALLAGGELEEDFADLAPTSIYRGLPPTRWDDLERSLLLRRLEAADWWWSARRERQLRRQMQRHGDARVVYVNGAPSVELARLLPPAERVLLSHVHELEIGLTHLLHPQDRLLFLEGPRQLFAASDAVRTNLIDRHGIDPSVIVHHTEMVDARGWAGVDRSPAARAERRRARGLPPDGLVVGSSGTLDWRKAPDLFLRMVWHLAQVERAEPVTFVWVGGGDERIERMGEEARNLGVDHLVRFVGVQPDPVDWFALMDVFVLPAREDPFPLVCLEAAAVGVPIVAFDNGGIPELLEQGCGLVVPYPDVSGLAGKVDELLRDPERRQRMGMRGVELVQSDQDVNVAAPKLWADVERWLA